MVITELDPPCFYAVRLTKGGPRCPLKYWWGLPADPVTGELLDRSPRWNVLLNGEFVDPDRVLIIRGGINDAKGYVDVKGEEITETEYLYLLQVRDWATTYAPDAPEANPREKIDLNRLKPIF